MNPTPSPLSIAYPSPDFKITNKAGKQFIWDTIRKKQIVLTPEEWVRQNFIQFLIQIKKYPASLLSIEKEIKVAERLKRCDIVVYKESQPWMIVECKEPKISLNEETLNQILNYNMALNVPFLILTNGPTTYGIERSTNQWKFLMELPEWE